MRIVIRMLLPYLLGGLVRAAHVMMVTGIMLNGAAAVDSIQVVLGQVERFIAQLLRSGRLDKKSIRKRRMGAGVKSR